MTERYKNEDVLYEMYWEKNMTQVEIADELGCYPGSVSYWMKKNGIDTRRGSEALARKEFSVTDTQHKILSGILMSDGNANKNSTTSIEVSMSNKKFIYWLNNKLGDLSTGVKHRTFSDERSDHYRVRTRNLSELDQYREWYSTGEKVWPDDLILYPETLKMLYVGDGTIVDNPGGSQYLKICLKNEHNNTEKVEKMFQKIGVQPRWHGYSIEFTVPESHYLWNYMGSAPPGFEYKWPNDAMNKEQIAEALGDSVEVIDRVEPFLSIKAN
jgi:hypothetical protein